MFGKGSAIVHPTHGVGRIVDIRSMAVSGTPQHYYYIKLSDDSGLLMVPVDYAEEAGLRPVADADLILDVLATAPTVLNENYRLRQTHMAQKIESGDPVKIAEALRDLFWYGEMKKLSSGDARLKARASAMLAAELAAEQGPLDLEQAADRLTAVLLGALETHSFAGDQQA